MSSTLVFLKRYRRHLPGQEATSTALGIWLPGLNPARAHRPGDGGKSDLG